MSAKNIIHITVFWIHLN